MFDAFASLLGYAVMAQAGLIFVALLTIGAVRLVHRAMQKVFDLHGGIDTFREFIRWSDERERGAK